MGRSQTGKSCYRPPDSAISRHWPCSPGPQRCGPSSMGSRRRCWCSRWCAARGRHSAGLTGGAVGGAATQPVRLPARCPRGSPGQRRQGNGRRPILSGGAGLHGGAPSARRGLGHRRQVGPAQPPGRPRPGPDVHRRRGARRGPGGGAGRFGQRWRGILGARRLIRELDVADRVLTLDALHSCPKTARLSTRERTTSCR